MDKNKNPSRKRKRSAPNKKKIKTFTNEWKKKLAISYILYLKIRGIISLLFGKILTQRKDGKYFSQKKTDFDEEEIDLDGNRNSFIIMDLSLLSNALSERACCENCGNTSKFICKELQESGLGKNLELC